MARVMLRFSRSLLIEGLELGPALTVLLVFLDDAALRVTVERDETTVVFEDKLVGEQYTDGSLAASAFLVSGYDNLIASSGVDILLKNGMFIRLVFGNSCHGVLVTSVMSTSWRHKIVPGDGIRHAPFL